MDASGTLFPSEGRARRATSSGLEQAGAAAGLGGDVEPEVHVRGRGRNAPSWRSLEQTLLEEEGLVDVFHGLGLLGHRDGERAEADRLTRERLAQRGEDRPVHLVEPALVDLEQGEGGAGRRCAHGAVAAHFGVVAHALEETVGDTRCAAGSAGDLPCALRLERYSEDAGGALEDRDQILGLVVVEAGDESEAVAQRARDEPGAGRGAGEREAREVEPNR